MKNLYVHRQIEKTLLKILQQFPVIVVTGPRQSGKTTLLKNLFKERYKFVSFDDPLERERALSDPKLFLENLGHKVILDEIQYVPELLSYIKILVDRNRERRGLFILTGSQQFNLIKGLTETLAGRVAILNLLGFSRKERFAIPSLKPKISDPLKDFIYTSLRGSFPEMVIYKNKDIKVWYASYLQTYIERDIRLIYDIGNIREFGMFMRLLASRISQILNLSNIANDIGIAVNTAKKWLSLLEASNIVYLLYPYYRNLGKRITKAPKIYFLDSGIICYLTGIDTQRQILEGLLSGGLFENYCIAETIKCFYNQAKRPNIFYLRTQNGLEVDLIIEKVNKIYPFEIKLTKTPNIGLARPLERFKKVFGKLNIDKGRLISLSKEECSLTKEVGLISLDNYLDELSGCFSTR